MIIQINLMVFWSLATNFDAKFHIAKIYLSIWCHYSINILDFKANQNNIWESLECLACVYSQLEDFDKAAVNILKAIEFYASYCERKNLDGDEKIRSRLDSKSKQIERHAKTNITSRPSLKEFTNNDEVYEDGLNDNRNNNNHDNNSSSNNEEPIETREIFEYEEEKNEKEREEDEVESSRRSNNGSKLSGPSEEAHSDRASILEQMRHDENAQETDVDNKEDGEEEEEKRNDDDDDDDVVEGNETLIANHESMKRLIQDLKFHNQAKAEEESDHDEVRMFKEQIIELNTTKKYEYIHLNSNIINRLWTVD